MRRFTILASLAPLGIALAGCGSAADHEAAEAQGAAINTGERARMADAFVDAFGVNTHLDYGGYADRFRSVVKPALRGIGIRHIRDGAGYFDKGSNADMMRELNRDLGIRVNLVLSHEDPADGVPRV